MPYTIEILPSALRQIDDLPRDAQKGVHDLIEGLKTNPRPMGYDILAGMPREKIHRIRTGDYRVLYQVFDGRLVVLIVRVADRREAYSDSVMKRLRKQLRGR